MRILFLLSFFIFLAQGTLAQKDSTQVRPLRLAIVGGGAASVLGGSYAYIQKSWWSDNASEFHFDDGSDLRYAKNVDKGGHFFGGVIVSDMFQGSLRWAGVSEKKAYWYGAAMGSFVQLSIEMKDAYAPHWGFSVWDFAAGSVGSLVPIAERYWESMQYVDFKMSYYKRSNHYWDLGTIQKPYAPPHPHAYQDDYINQTYWMSFFPFRNQGNHIGVSIGFGLDDTQYLERNTKVGGNNEWYIALDYDLKELLKKWDTPTGKKVIKCLSYFKFPAPTIRISPSLEFYPIFF